MRKGEGGGGSGYEGEHGTLESRTKQGIENLSGTLASFLFCLSKIMELRKSFPDAPQKKNFPPLTVYL